MLTPSNTLLSRLYKYKFLRKLSHLLFSDTLKNKIKKSFFISKTKQELAESELKMVSNYYEDEISNLEILINTDLSSWKK